MTLDLRLLTFLQVGALCTVPACGGTVVDNDGLNGTDFLETPDIQEKEEEEKDEEGKDEKKKRRKDKCMEGRKEGRMKGRDE